MQNVSGKANLKNRFASVIRSWQPFRIYRESTLVVEDSKQINLRRISLLTLIAIPVHVAVIFQFAGSPSGSTNLEIIWRQGIIMCHSILLVMMITLQLLSHLIKNKPQTSLAPHLLHHLTVGMIIASGVAITALDQLVTSNITPFLIACLLIGSVFLIRPVFSFFYFFAGYVAYFFLIDLNPASADVVLSNRVNGLVAAAIGFALSCMMWRYNVINFKQEKRILQQQQLLEEKNLELEQMAYFDSLTALPNRRYFDQVTNREIALIQRNGHQSSLIMLDIDHFKDVNDNYGHPAGDTILKQIARLLQSCIRQSDLIARLGGEEFIILLPGTTLDGARSAAEKLRTAIENMSFIADQQAVRITASFGVASFSAASLQQSNYYSECDKALYKAKANGRNRVESYGIA